MHSVLEIRSVNVLQGREIESDRKHLSASKKGKLPGVASNVIEIYGCD